MKQIRLLSGFLTVGFWTLASRILGFLREVAILALIGPGPLLDAFVAAFRLPNMFRRFFAEGAFNAAFVPMFSRKYEQGDGAVSFASNALSWLAAITLVLTGLAMVFMPALIWATAGGFDALRFDLAVGFGPIMFPYIVFMSLSALFSGMLNATGRFAVAAAAPVMLNVLILISLCLSWILELPAINWLIWTIPVAGVVQLSMTWLAAAKAGVGLRLQRPKADPEMGLLLKTAVPAALAAGVMQINLVVGQIVASRFDNAVSWLFAADRLYQLPLGVVGIAVGIVLLPELSRKLSAGDELGARGAYTRATQFALALTIPAAVALIVVPLPLVSVLFERGATDFEDSKSIALAVAIYGLGLPAFVLQKTVQPQYFARGDTKRPFYFAVTAMVVNAAIAVGLAPKLGWIAPAIATTAAAWVMLAQLYLGLSRFGVTARLETQFHRAIIRIIAASAVMGAALWAFDTALSRWLYEPGWRYLALAALVSSAMAIYFVLAIKLKILDLSAFRRSRSTP